MRGLKMFPIFSVEMNEKLVVTKVNECMLMMIMRVYKKDF